jgi:hypothetical protein
MRAAVITTMPNDLIDLVACQRFNIKLGKSGGLFKAKKIITLAEQAGLEVQVGGFLESRSRMDRRRAFGHDQRCRALLRHGYAADVREPIRW